MLVKLSLGINWRCKRQRNCLIYDYTSPDFYIRKKPDIRVWTPANQESCHQKAFCLFARSARSSALFSILSPGYPLLLAQYSTLHIVARYEVRLLIRFKNEQNCRLYDPAKFIIWVSTPRLPANLGQYFKILGTNCTV